jgi:carbon-monoxide dehydrogenase medium subunit
MKPFEYYAPDTLSDALQLLAHHGPKARPLAGGTDLFLRMERGGWAPEAVVGATPLRAWAALANALSRARGTEPGPRGPM